MEILVVNPNTTASMTDKIRAAAEAVASRGTRITAVNPEIGPESIEGYYDEALAVPGLLAEIGKGEARGVAGHVIACFDDTGLDAAEAPKMMSVGLHARLVGRPGRLAGLARFLDHVAKHDRVWICRRLDIAKHWAATHPYQAP